MSGGITVRDCTPVPHKCSARREGQIRCDICFEILRDAPNPYPIYDSEGRTGDWAWHDAYGHTHYGYTSYRKALKAMFRYMEELERSKRVSRWARFKRLMKKLWADQHTGSIAG